MLFKTSEISLKMYKAYGCCNWKNLKAKLIVPQKTTNGEFIAEGTEVTILRKNMILLKGNTTTFNSGYFRVLTCNGQFLKVNYSHLQLSSTNNAYKNKINRL